MKRFKSSPPMPYGSSLKRSPSYRTLSNALDISRNTPLTSIVGLQSKEEFISWTIDNNWKMQESPGMKPDWIFVKNCCNKSDWINPCMLISQISYPGLEVNLKVYNFLSDFNFLFYEQVPHFVFSNNQNIYLLEVFL